MYDSNTNGFAGRDREFQTILGNAAETIRTRLGKYKHDTGPIERSRLKFLHDIVCLEIEKVESGMADTYSGLSGPIKAVKDWGEPPDSELIAAFLNAEAYYRRNYATNFLAECVGQLQNHS